MLSLGPSLLVLVVGNTSPLLAGGAACVMFLAATGSQIVLTRLGTASTVLAMIAVVLTLFTKNPVLFVASAILAGAGQGLAQMGGLRLIAHHVEGNRRAEANAALNISAYLPAAILTVATGYAVGGWGMRPAVTVLAATLAVLGLLMGVGRLPLPRGRVRASASMTRRNALLSIQGRRRLIQRCESRPIARVAAEMGISRACVSKRANRYRRHGSLPA